MAKTFESFKLGYKAGHTDAYWERHGYNMHLNAEIDYLLDCIRGARITEWQIGFICGVYSSQYKDA